LPCNLEAEYTAKPPGKNKTYFHDLNLVKKSKNSPTTKLNGSSKEFTEKFSKIRTPIGSES